MKNKFFDFKLIAIMFLVLLSIVIIFLSGESSSDIKEVTKEVNIHKIVR